MRWKTSLDLLALPTAGELMCVFHDGAFVAIDCNHVSAISKQPLAVAP